MWTPCVPKSCGLLQSYCVQQFLFSVIGYLYNHIYVCELRVHTLSEVGATPRQELILLSRMRRRDMTRLFDSGVGSSLSDSVRLVSMPTTRSSAVLRCRVRIGARFEDCEFASS